MGIFLDSAEVPDASWAQQTGFIAGITTNPTLLAGVDPLERIPQLLEAFQNGPVCCQLTELDSASALLAQGEQIFSLAPDRVVIKVPTRTETLSLANKLIEGGIRCAMTAIFTPEQAAVAGEIGAEWVIPYVGRTTRLGGDGIELVSAMRRVFDANGAETRVMAGSIKSSQGVADIFVAGAHDITAARSVIDGLGDHEWSEKAITDFAAAVRSDGRA